MEFYFSLILVFAALFCWGSWSNTLLFNKGCFEVYFLGMCFGYGLTGLFALENPSDLQFHDNLSILIAIGAGALNSVGQLSLVFAINLTGMTIAYPLIMGIELIFGTILLYFQDSNEDAWFLFSGVFLVLLAVGCDILSQLQIIQDESNEELSGLLKATASATDLMNEINQDSAEDEVSRKLTHGTSRVEVLSSLINDRESRYSVTAFGPRLSTVAGLETNSVKHIRRSSMAMLANAGFIEFEDEDRKKHEFPLEPRGSGGGRKPTHSPKWKKLTSEENDQKPIPVDERSEPHYWRIILGVGVAAIAGFCFAGWPALIGADKLNWKEFYMCFACGMFLMSLVTVPISLFFSKPDSEEVRFSSFLWGVLGGVIQGSGSFLLFWAKETIQLVVAISITRCSPIVAALWGIFFWKELAHASATAMLYIVLMFICYICAIFLIALSDRS